MPNPAIERTCPGKPGHASHLHVSLHMSTTDIAAWYAAVVATVVLVWDIFKWQRGFARLRISCKCNVSYPDGRVLETQSLESGSELRRLAEYCHIEVLNVGSQPTTLISIEGTHKPTKSGVQASTSGFIVHAGSQPLPALIGPGQMWSCRLEMKHLEIIAKQGQPFILLRTSLRDRPFRGRIKMDATFSSHPLRRQSAG